MYVSDHHERQTRSTTLELLHIPRSHSANFDRAFSVQGPKLLNSLPADIRNSNPIGNRSFHTQVISYPSHFVPFWSFRTYFFFSIWSFRTQFGHFVPISYPVWSYRTYFYYFLETRFGHFVPIFYCFVPRSFRTHFQTKYELTWVRNDFLFLL